MKTCWVFIQKKGDSSNLIHDVKVYGSITIMSKAEMIIVGEKRKTEGTLRHLLKDGIYSDENYLIVKREVKRSTHKKD